MKLYYKKIEDEYPYGEIYPSTSREQLLCDFVNNNHIKRENIETIYDTTRGSVVIIYWAEGEHDL